MRKPWNLPSYPVYSLLTENTRKEGNFQRNMNIMTYAIPVSMLPKHYILAIYHGTKSLENWSHTHRGILQILSPDHAILVRVLGKKSRKDYDKMKYLEKKGLLSHDGLLSGIAGYLELEEIEDLGDRGGDHSLYLCRVLSSRSYHEEVLTTKMLQDRGVIL